MAQEATQFPYVDLIAYQLPSHRDGFLATNSLVASATLLYLAYQAVFTPGSLVPHDLEALVVPEGDLAEFRLRLAQDLTPLWERQHTIVLHGSTTRAAAWDLESKFTEAALGTTQIADFRHFAHGRHHWLAKHPMSTGVLALVSADIDRLAYRTLSLLPPDVRVASVPIPHREMLAGLAALTTSLYIAGLAGEARSIDPGRPGVPSFGSRIYKLSAYPKESTPPDRISSIEAKAIERKSCRSIEALASGGELPLWRAAYQRFLQTIETVEFGAIIFDWDGTLCDRQDRRCGLCQEAAGAIIDLLRSGLRVGIATGRGKSVRDDLRAKVPSDLWSNIIVGYYNGSDIAPIDDDSHPDNVTPPTEILRDLAVLLNREPLLQHLVRITPRHRQITIECCQPDPQDRIWHTCQDIIHRVAEGKVQLLRSGHSLDLVEAGVTKCALIPALGRLGPESAAPALCIGDRGRWPGNDFALLKSPYSLSVDQVSLALDSCWNLSPPGCRGLQATLRYLSSLSVTQTPVRGRLCLSDRLDQR